MGCDGKSIWALKGLGEGSTLGVYEMNRITARCLKDSAAPRGDGFKVGACVWRCAQESWAAIESPEEWDARRSKGLKYIETTEKKLHVVSGRVEDLGCLGPFVDVSAGRTGLGEEQRMELKAPPAPQLHVGRP